jgi:ATP-dependent DNA ligase
METNIPRSATFDSSCATFFDPLHLRAISAVLQNELKGKSTKIVLVAFDLLYLNGHDLRKLPLMERKAQLKKLIAKTAIQFSESFEVDGRKMYEHACSIGPRRCRLQPQSGPKRDDVRIRFHSEAA